MKKYYLILLLSSVVLSGCAMLEPPGTQQVTMICDHMLEQTKAKWHDATLDEIYKDNPEADMEQKEWFEGMSHALGVCQSKIYTGAGRSEDRLVLGELKDRINHHYTKQEEKIFIERTGGKKLCKVYELEDIIVFNNKPSRECVYFNNRPSIYVSQVTPNGLLVNGYGVDRPYFIFKNSEIDNSLVDNDRLPMGFFQYTGPYSYQSLFGQRTVHSFKRIQGRPMEGFLFYGVKKR